jgi:acyl-CoA thioesterase FadM
MNLYFRMLILLFRSIGSDRITLDNLRNSLSHRVLPNDLDMNLHMNNGRYLTICDLSRVDFFFRTGLLRLMLRNKWMPIIAFHDMTFIKPLKPFQKYEVEMIVERWDEKYFYCKHHFTSNGKKVAEGVSKAGIRNIEGVLSPQTVLDHIREYQRGEL